MTTELVELPDQNITYLYSKSLNKYEPYDLKTGKKLTDIAEREDSYIHYTTEVGDFICDQLRQGKTLKAIVDESKSLSMAQVYAWRALIPEFKLRYDDARKHRAEAFHDRAIEVAEEALYGGKDNVPGAKLLVDTMKWAAEKNDPEKFGKKEERVQGSGNIRIVLNTGVLETPMPRDVMVDATGNFIGFTGEDDGTEYEMGEGRGQDDIEVCPVGS